MLYDSLMNPENEKRKELFAHCEKTKTPLLSYVCIIYLKEKKISIPDTTHFLFWLNLLIFMAK